MADFNLYKSTALLFEGGFQNIPSDNGNYNSLGVLAGTNLGISARFYETILGYPPTELDMKLITKQRAESILKIHFWDFALADKIESQKVAETIVDHSINAGPKAAAYITQEVLKKYFNKNIAIDGSIGMQTINHINSVNDRKLFVKISQYRLINYSQINNPDWINVWENRVYNLAKKFNVNISNKWFNLGLVLIVLTGIILYRNSKEKRIWNLT
jgi:lysozyme family protein